MRKTKDKKKDIFLKNLVKFPCSSTAIMVVRSLLALSDLEVEYAIGFYFFGLSAIIIDLPYSPNYPDTSMEYIKSSMPMNDLQKS